MEHIISISEVVEGPLRELRPVDIFATADASYDPNTKKVAVTLGSFLRPVPGTEDDEALCAAWLQTSRRVTERLPREEVVAYTKDVFAHWVRTVRSAVPVHLDSV